MNFQRIRVVDSFNKCTCGVCGHEEVNEYFGVNESFIDYQGVYISFREVLSESLDLKVT